ncbi:MAG: thioredoxin domain-containing protein [Desulfobacterales bacterium]
MEQSTQQLIKCSKCGAKNRLPHEKISGVPKCGKCGAALEMEQTGAEGDGSYLIRCMKCKTRNRIPSQKINSGARCGKCGELLDTDELFEAQPLMISENNFNQKVLGSPIPVLVFAWAPWCPTCRAAMPVIDDFAKDAKGKIRVGKLNVDSSQSLSSTYNILSVPQILVFDNGSLQESMPGAMQKHEIMMKMARYL